MPDVSTENRSLLIRRARVVLPHGVARGASLLTKNGVIARVSHSGAMDSKEVVRHDSVLDLDGLTLFPGFIDVHIHGAAGFDTMEADAAGLHEVSLFLARHGVTAWMPTLVPAPVKDYKRAAGAVSRLIREQDEAGGRTPPAARALGLHYEGPFVNDAQCGALRTQFFRKFSNVSELDALATLDAAGARHMMTLAPEVEGGIELVRELRARGWIVSVGHTRADIEMLELARAAGARHMTHFPNAMPTLHHRAPGPVGWGLMRDDVTCDVIADGVHTDPLMLRLVLRCKSAERVTLISDAVAPAGMGDGDFQVWGETIKVAEGRTSNARGSIAGSAITMRDAVKTMRSLGFGDHEIALMASRNPARLLGVEGACGTIEEGKRADLTALDAEGNVKLTIIGGRVAYNELA